jgi:translation initiation factor 1
MGVKDTKTTTTVYSTEHGRICPECGKPAASCRCGQKRAASRGDGIVRIGRETKGRKGKGVTTISGVPLDAAGLQALAQDLKKRCGSGGAVKDGVIEIQGDHRALLLEALAKRWPTKLSGG